MVEICPLPRNRWAEQSAHAFFPGSPAIERTPTVASPSPAIALVPRLACFLIQAADDLESRPNFGHLHASDWAHDWPDAAPEVIVFDPR